MLNRLDRIRECLPARSAALAFAACAAAGFGTSNAIDTPAGAKGVPATPRTSVVAQIGRIDPGVVTRSDALVFDSFSGSPTFTMLAAENRSFIGMPFTLDAASGSIPEIGMVRVFVAYTGASTRMFTSLGVQLQFWDTWSGSDDPVFSNPLRLLPHYYVLNDFTLGPNSYTPLDIVIDPPIPMSAAQVHGISLTFDGYADEWVYGELTSLLRHGSSVPIAQGTNALQGSYGYRTDGRSDFNFSPGDSLLSGESNSSLVLQFYSTQRPDLIFADGFDVFG